MPYNSNTNRKNVSTNIKTFYGDTASMGMTYWNDMISIRLNPCSGTNEDGIRQYDRNRSFSTAITAQKALGLTQLIDEHIVSVIKKVEAGEDLEKPVNVAMKMGNKNAIIVIQYAKDDKGVPTLYFIGYVSANQDNTCDPSNRYIYKFNKTKVVLDYDPNTGNGTVKATEAEFMFFYNALKNINDIFGVSTQSNAFFNSWGNGLQTGNNAQSSDVPSTSPSANSAFSAEDLPF